MTCHRCRGLMIRQRPWSFFIEWRCFNCGNYLDRRILENRLPAKERQHLDDARARAEAIFSRP